MRNFLSFRKWFNNNLLIIINGFWQVVNHCLLWDTDNDGLIENGGFPDQTFDTWVMKGPRYEGWKGFIHLSII